MAQEKQERQGSSVIFKGQPNQVLDDVRAMAQSAREMAGGEAEDKEKLSLKELLDDSSLKVMCSRVDPPYPAKLFDQESGVYRALVTEVEFNTPTSLPEVKKFIEKTYGGKRWFVGVFDEEGHKLGGTHIDIKHGPKAVFDDEETQQQQQYRGWTPTWGMQPGQQGFRSPYGHPGYPQTPPLIETDDDDDGDDDWTKKETLQEKIERQRAEFQLKKEREEYEEERKARRDEGRGMKKEELRSMISDLFTSVVVPKIDNIAKDMDKKFGDLEKDLDRDIGDLKGKVESTQASVDGKLDIAMRDIKTEMQGLQHKSDLEKMETKNSQERALTEMRGGLDRVKDSLTQEFNNIRSALDKAQDGKGMAEIMANMQNTTSQQITQLTSSMITAMTAKADGQDSIEKFTNAFATMAAIMNPQEGPKDALTLAAEAVKDAIPEVSGYLKARIDAGKEITEEVVGKKIDEAVTKLAPEVTGHLEKTVKTEIAKRVNKMLPKKKIPAPGPGQKPPRPPTPAKPSPAPQQPPAEQPKAPPQPASSPPQPTPEQKLHAETSQRVNGMLAVLLEEINIQPAEAQFVGYGLSYLPKAFLKKMTEVEGPSDVAVLFQTYADQQYIDRLMSELIDSDEKRGWVEEQIKIMLEEFVTGELERVAAATPLAPSAPAPDSTQAPPASATDSQTTNETAPSEVKHEAATTSTVAPGENSTVVDESNDVPSGKSAVTD